ncbi:MAG: hypothetical protein K9K67_05540 [Bacteriovoracaceae bacterium]|nr:hypothetical protein [Bacteriovoracaceae bacterium]
MESLRLVLTQFTDETISISLAVLVVVFAGLVAYWFYNRRKFHQLSHQIPASVVKNYLDSIIANSTALKSSLFRGGGLELGQGIPSIIPTSDLPIGGVSVGGDNSEALAQKNAEIANLKSLVGQKDATIAELEKMLDAARSSNGGGVSEEEVGILKSEIESLKAQLEESNSALENARAGGDGGGDAALEAQIDSVTKERDELRERLMEYEIIEEDLANLKKFQQENEQLKKTIAELKGGAAAEESPAEEEPADEPEAEAPAEEPAAEEVSEEPAPEPPPEVTAEENPAADDAATAAAAEENPDVPENDGEQKSAAELLSEFEKMLG